MEESLTKGKFHIFDLVGGYCKKVYTTDKAKTDVNENFHLVRVWQFHEENDDKYFHWVPIIDTFLFWEKFILEVVKLVWVKT